MTHTYTVSGMSCDSCRSKIKKNAMKLWR
ncbi:cation transporter [Flavobacterium sp. ZS1P14]